MKLVARMINIRPDDRLSTSDVLSGPGFKNFSDFNIFNVIFVNKQNAFKRKDNRTENKIGCLHRLSYTQQSVFDQVMMHSVHIFCKSARSPSPFEKM